MSWLNCPRILEILEDPDHRLSSTKFCVLIGQLVGCFVIGRLTWNDKLTLDMFSVFLLYSGGLYGLGRFATVSEKNAEVKAAQPAAPAVVPVPMPTPAGAQNININMPTAPTAPPTDMKAADVNLTAQGDVNFQGEKNV